MLEQSQPRVSRHLKLMAEAGLIERFPDGAWVFYRLTGAGQSRERWSSTILATCCRRRRPGARSSTGWTTSQAERAAGGRRPISNENAPQWDRIRSLYVAETAVEAADRPGGRARAASSGSSTWAPAPGRMLTLLGPQAPIVGGPGPVASSMLNIARANVERGRAWTKVELRHGDIFATRLPDASADLVLVHQVLHYLADPAAAVTEAARLVRRGGRLLIVDFAPHAA